MKSYYLIERKKLTMKREDRTGRRIFSENIWSEMLSTGKKLIDLGYSESVNKPNLFHCNKEYGIFFADLRGTKYVPIWDDPRPLIYWTLNIDQPLWKRRRYVKKELLNLEEKNVKYCLDYVVEDSLFEQSNVLGDSVNLIFPWFDGYCEFCGKDFQNKGRFCSTECEKKSIEQFEKEQEEERLRLIRKGPLIECCVCKKNTRENPEIFFEEHHVSYYPEKKVMTCRSCHKKIHVTDAYPNLKPKTKRLLKKEIRELKRIAEIELAKRNGTFRGKYCAICERVISARQSYTFHYGKRIHTKCLDNKSEFKDSHSKN